MHTQEEAVRLREEVSYKRFYPDLDSTMMLFSQKKLEGRARWAVMMKMQAYYNI